MLIRAVFDRCKRTLRPAYVGRFFKFQIKVLKDKKFRKFAILKTAGVAVEKILSSNKFAGDVI